MFENIYHIASVLRNVQIELLLWYFVVLFASPSKSKIRVLQSIGRVLRTSKDKFNATLFDIADDLSYKNRDNYTLRHFKERINTYSKEKFKYTIHEVKFWVNTDI